MSDAIKRKPKNPIRFQVTLNEEQKAAKAVILQNKITVLKGGAGSGKAQPLDSLVLTPTGYVRMGDIKEGMFVSTPDGKSAQVLGVFPQGIKEVAEVCFNDGTKVLCCTEHLWAVQHRRDKHSPLRRNGYANKKHGKFEVKTTKELMELGIKDTMNLNKWFIPITAPIEFSQPWIEDKIDPYILGCLIGDGTLGCTTPNITSADAEVVEAFRYFAESNNLRLKDKGKYTYALPKATFAANGGSRRSWLTNTLDDLGLLGSKSQTKFIPKQYLLASVEDRRALLRGLLDTDGGVESGNITFNTTSSQLAEDVRFLVQSLGGVARISMRAAKYLGVATGSTTHKVNIVLPTEMREGVFGLTRKQTKIRNNKKEPNRSIESIKVVGELECQCIYVDSDDHLYMTDGCVVTHNSMVAAQIALDLLFTRQVEKIILTRPAVTSGEELGFMPGDKDAKLAPYTAAIYDAMYRLYNKEKIDKEVTEGRIEVIPVAFMRGRNLSNCCVVVDEAQNISHRQMELILGRLCEGSKMIICGDTAQIDLKDKKMSGFGFICHNLSAVPGFAVVTLKTNHRDPIVEDILKIYNDHRD